MSDLIVFIIVGIMIYFIIKNLRGILASILVVVLITPVLFFVMNDILRFPISDYLGGYDARDDIERRVEDLKDKGGEYISKEDGSEVDYVDIDETEQDKISGYEEYVTYDEENKKIYISYDIDDGDRSDFINEISKDIMDKRFKEKMMGMNRYVDVSYDLGNAQLFNEDQKYIVIQFK